MLIAVRVYLVLGLLIGPQKAQIVETTKPHKAANVLSSQCLKPHSVSANLKRD